MADSLTASTALPRHSSFATSRAAGRSAYGKARKRTINPGPTANAVRADRSSAADREIGGGPHHSVDASADRSAGHASPRPGHAGSPVAHAGAEAGDPVTAPAPGREDDPVQSKPLLTTGEAARLCGLSQQTIIRCFDRGLLNGFRVPGSLSRRIPREALVQFMQRNRIPTDQLEGSRAQVLIVDHATPSIESLAAELRGTGTLDARVASCAYEAGALTERFTPNVVIIDPSLTDVAGVPIVQRILSDPQLNDTRVILICEPIYRARYVSLLERGLTGIFVKPVNIAHLREDVLRLVRPAAAGPARRYSQSVG